MPARNLATGVAAALAAPLLLASGCALFEAAGLAPNEPDPAAVRRPEGERDEPAHVVVRHVLIAFDETDLPGVTRTKAQAEALAAKVAQMARSGRDFAELVRLYSDDRHGDGSYALANWGVLPGPDEMERERMKAGFGRVAFSLEPGGIGVAEYDASESPFGWHVIRRDR